MLLEKAIPMLMSIDSTDAMSAMVHHDGRRVMLMAMRCDASASAAVERRTDPRQQRVTRGITNNVSRHRPTFATCSFLPATFAKLPYVFSPNFFPPSGCSTSRRKSKDLSSVATRHLLRVTATANQRFSPRKCRMPMPTKSKSKSIQRHSQF